MLSPTFYKEYGKMMNAYNPLFAETSLQQQSLQDYIQNNLPGIVELTNFDDTGLLTSLPRILVALQGTVQKRDSSRIDRIITSAGELPCVKKFVNGELVYNELDVNHFKQTLELSHWILVSKLLSSGKAIAYLYSKHANGEWYLTITATTSGSKCVPGVVSALCKRFEVDSKEVYKAISKVMLLNHANHEDPRPRRANVYIR